MPKTIEQKIAQLREVVIYTNDEGLYDMRLILVEVLEDLHARVKHLESAAKESKNKAWMFDTY